MTRSLKDQGNGDGDALRDAIESRSGKSESELLGELYELTQQERAAGRMDNTVMDGLYEKLSPMLTNKQRDKMREVLSRLKE